jgi:hypothetical protein
VGWGKHGLDYSGSGEEQVADELHKIRVIL